MTLLSPELVAELEASGLPRRTPGCREPRCRRPHHLHGLCRPHFDARERRLDWSAVDRAVAKPVPPYTLNHNEAMCAAWILTQRGMSAQNIAARLHVSQRTVVRYRKAWRKALQETE